MEDWIRVCALEDIEVDDVTRFDHAGRTYAVCRTAAGVFATDGLCTHEQVHLGGGFVMDHVIECPKHNGRFDIRNGRALGAPVCVNLATYPARVQAGEIQIRIATDKP